MSKDFSSLKAASPKKRLSQFVQACWKRWHEFARYVIFGCLNTILTYAIYVICLMVVDYRMAYTITSGCGVLMSYVFNAQFVFKRQLRLAVACQFVLVYFVQYLVGMSLLYGLVEIAGVSKLTAPILILFIVADKLHLKSSGDKKTVAESSRGSGAIPIAKRFVLPRD